MRYPAATLAVLLLALSAGTSLAGKPKLFLGGVIVEGEVATGGNTAAEWTKSLGGRLADRFEVLSAATPPQDLDGALAFARAARVDYLLETRYTRVGSSSSLDMILMDTAGRVVETVSADASLQSGGQGDMVRLGVSATSRLTQRVFGEGGGRGSVRFTPPGGNVERSSPRSGPIEASSFVRIGKGGGTAWLVASAGNVRFYPVKGVEPGTPIAVSIYTPGAPPAGVAGGEMDGDGKEEVFIAAADRKKAESEMFRRSGDSFRPERKGRIEGIPMRVAGSDASPLLLAAFPTAGSTSYRTVRIDGKGGGTLVTGSAGLTAKGNDSNRRDVYVVSLLPGGIPVRVRLDGSGRLLREPGDGPGEPLASVGRVGAGRTTLFPADVDRDGSDEVLAVTAKERPGTFFPSIPTPYGSEISCFSIPATEAPRLEWKVAISETGIVDAGYDGTGSLHLLAVTAVDGSSEASWHVVRLK